MRVLDLFSGIGGFSLGLERAGMRTVAFCEIDPFCRAVLRKHWPAVPCYGDVRAVTAERLAADGITPDLICGGFPCQDISVAGKAAGIKGTRSGLWTEFARIIGEVRPKFVMVENVSALLGRGAGTVLRDLAALDYDCVGHCIPASAVGAPHRRDRLWIIAYPSGEGRKGLSIGAAAAYALSGQRSGWPSEPGIPRVDDGVPNRLDRARALGNALTPPIAQVLGEAVMSDLRSVTKALRKSNNDSGGRPPIGIAAMTNAERQKRYRDKQRMAAE